MGSMRNYALCDCLTDSKAPKYINVIKMLLQSNVKQIGEMEAEEKVFFSALNAEIMQNIFGERSDVG